MPSPAIRSSDVDGSINSRVVNRLFQASSLTDYYLAHSSRGELLRRAGIVQAAKASFVRALSLAKQEPERRFLLRMGENKPIKPLCFVRGTCSTHGMPRSPRADEAGGLYHALNRANLAAKIFRKTGDFVAFEKVLPEALQLYKVELYEYQIMGTHWHPHDRKRSSLSGTLQEFSDSVPEPKLLSPWPIPRLPNWVDRVNRTTRG
jgi:hypothetical protein